uniref:MHC class I-like antigen recognition-like domain-containing protein n=1 Tax=Periophthalmus magnuspinnatus TaxID=409849 RepID=A0A3B4B469_9GOBI
LVLTKPAIFVFLFSFNREENYFYTGSSNVPNFPEFVAVGYVDDVQMVYYDSNTKEAEPKQDWMSKVTEDDPRYWEGQSQGLLENCQMCVYINML